LGKEALLELLGAEQLDRQRPQLLDHQDQRAGRARAGDLLDRHVEHQGPGARAAVLGVERQPQQILLGEQPPDVPRVLGLGVDLRRARRHPLAHDLADGVAELDLIGGQRVRVNGGCRHRPLRLVAGHSGETDPVGIGTSLFLIAIGAILKFAVDASVSGIEIATVGVILMVVGVVGLLISLFFLGEWRRRYRAPVEERPVARDREYY